MKKFSNYIAIIKDELRSQLEYLEHLKLPETKLIIDIDIEDEVFLLSAKEIRKKYSLPPNNDQVIYIISLEGFHNELDNYSDIMTSIGEIKKNYKNEYSQITTINQANLRYHKEKNSDCVIMYIGTSKSFASRVQTHVGFGSKGNATVCLRYWPCLKNKKLKLKFNYLNFGNEVAVETLKFLEFHLSNDLKPIIGHNRRA